MRIAIVGSGISGLTAAHLLHREHQVEVFEASGWIGGHTHTVDVELRGRRYAVDTGFIVFNDRTYPNFIALMETLGVPTQPSTMSFSVRCERTGLEYNGTSLNTLFAQRRNLLRPAFHRMIRDILRFNREAPALLDAPGARLTLGEYLERGRFAPEFIRHYLVPMGAAIWSTDPARLLEFPAQFMIRFFHHHGMLTVNDRPQWRVIRGGSRNYVERLVAPFRAHVHIHTPVAGVRRLPSGVEVELPGGGARRFDAIFLACHSDQALRLLRDPTDAEREVLGAIPYQTNDVVLHTDTRLLPRNRLARAAWNYHLPREPLAAAAVTYDMNRLQSLDAPETFCVTLNRGDAVDPSMVIARFSYDHPLFTAASVAAQGRHGELNGAQRTYYCGAYWRNGFHEDGVVSAQSAVRDFLARERAAEGGCLRERSGSA